MADFERLALLFKRTRSLPELPGSILRLVSAIDSGEASAIDIERIITADPSLSIRLLAVANSAACGSFGTDITTIRGAIMRLGQRSVRSLALSLMMHNFWNSKTESQVFNTQRFARHSLFTGFLSRYLYARRNLQEPFMSEWSCDEVFSAALLHDLGTALLFKVAPEAHLRVHHFAQRMGCSVNDAFHQIFKHRINDLGSAAAEAWGLPKMFSESVAMYPEPWMMQEEFTALCCIHYADYLAALHGATLEDWPIHPSLEPEVESEVGLASEEIGQVLALVEQQVAKFLAGATEVAA